MRSEDIAKVMIIRYNEIYFSDIYFHDGIDKYIRTSAGDGYYDSRIFSTGNPIPNKFLIEDVQMFILYPYGDSYYWDNCLIYEGATRYSVDSLSWER